MKRYRIRIRLKIYQVIWGVIIIVSAYLLIKFALLSFPDNVGQAGIMDTLISGLCSRVMEQSSLVSYSSKEKGGESLFLDMVGDSFALHNYIKEDEAAEVYAQSNSAILQNDVLTPKTDKNDVVSEAANSGGSFRFHDEAGDYIGLEYLLTNGAVIQSEAAGRLIWDEDISASQLNIGYLQGDISPAAESMEKEEALQTSALATGQITDFTMEQLRDVNFLVHNFYFVDESTSVTDSLFDGEKLVSSDMTIKQGNDAPQILIYSTHSQEAFADSRPGVEDDTVVGIGTLLAKVLSEDYGYNVIHDTSYYDVINGYNMSYSSAEAGITKDLKENPSLEVLIDLHRNSGAEKLVMINGTETAQVMLFNGLCRDQSGPMTDWENPYLQDNLAFSLQLQIKSFGLYPGLFKKNYLKSYRYNMHFRPKSLLIEWGSVKNTVESAKNAVEPFAQILDAVLKGYDNSAEEVIKN